MEFFVSFRWEKYQLFRLHYQRFFCSPQSDSWKFSTSKTPYMILFLLQNPFIFSAFWPPCCSLISLYFPSWCYEHLTLCLSRTPTGQLLCLNLDLWIRGELPDAKRADATFSLSAGHTGLLNESETAVAAWQTLQHQPHQGYKRNKHWACTDIKNFQQKVPCVSRRWLPSRSWGDPAIGAAAADDLVSYSLQIARNAPFT